MKNKFCKIILLTMVFAILASAMIGCKKNETYDDYSYGLKENGTYENLDQYPYELPDFSGWSFTCEEVLEWGAKRVHETGNEEVKDVDDYVYLYGKEFLSALNLANKEIAEEGDIVSATLSFYLDGAHLEDFDSTNNYEVGADGDEIVSSFLGHSANDEYEVKYTFPENDKDYAGKTADVKILINSVVCADPIKAGAIENNLDVIAEYLDGVTDEETYLEALAPQLALVTFDMFIEDKLQNFEGITTPDEYVEYELYRLKSRLAQLGYVYEDYLTETKMTDEEAREYCALVAKENYITMLIFNKFNIEITHEDLMQYYGDNLEYVISVQGEPYVRLNMMRDMVVYAVAEVATIEGIDDVQKDEVDNGDDENDTTQDATEETTESTESSDENLTDEGVDETTDPQTEIETQPAED